jgi:hypothetical protein
MIERKIIIGLISSTEYCEKVKDIWNIQLLESAAAKLIAGWAWEYFIKYSKAPGHEIETIYYSKLKDGKIQKNLAEEIEEDILPGLSAESTEEDVNLQYLIEETEKYFSSQHLKQLSDNVQALIAAGRISEANDLAIKFKPLDKVTVKLEDFILTVQKIREKGRPHPTILMKPWLREGQTTIIYGNYGSGKSLLAIAVAYMLGLRDYKTEDCEMGEWIIKNPTGTLYVDGELGEQEMDDRIQCFEWLGPQKYKMEILSVPEYQLSTGDTFYLSSRLNQLKIIKWLKEHPRYKLTVLDSASTLFGLENENDNSEWNNKVNPFLRDLRALGVACLLLHHSGKDNKRGLRGASAMGAMAHNIFRLTIPKEKDIDEGEAWFILSKDKQRTKGFMFKKFSLHFTQNEKQTETHWEIT